MNRSAYDGQGRWNDRASGRDQILHTAAGGPEHGRSEGAVDRRASGSVPR